MAHEIKPLETTDPWHGMCNPVTGRHLFEIKTGMGDSCLCGETKMNEAGKIVPREG